MTTNFNRRKFIELVALSTGAAAFPNITSGMVSFSAEDKKELVGYHESARDIPVKEIADVIVCGGGPAGIAAAIAAARTGANVRLFEVNGCLGGVWTAGLLTWIFDFDKPGLTREIVRKLDERGARRGRNPGLFVYEPEEMKLLAEEMCVGAGVKIRLHTRVVAAYKKGRRLNTIITESKSGREAWQASVFIDATGDGDLGALSGCGWDMGQEGTGSFQPLTMNALAVVHDVTQMQKYVSFYGGDLSWHIQATKNVRSEINRAGLEPSYGSPTIFHVRDNIVLLMFNHEYGVKPYDADAMTAATLHARREIFSIVRGLRKLGGVWGGLQVVSSAEQIGIREGRRLHGLYTIVKEDLIKGSRFDDGVTRATFGVDIHAATREKNDKEVISQGGIRTLPYDIPLRSLIAKDVDGLMMAGRCISGDFYAHASYRVTGNAVAMGEATGVVAAIAVKSKRLPCEVEWKEAKEILLQRDTLS